VITYNGEIYNFLQLREQLEREDPSSVFASQSDTEVMLACVDRWGIDASLRQWNGMFGFALWDQDERRLYLARDRFGEKPLYYGGLRNTFVFGSELKALRSHSQFRAEIDRDALALFLRYGYIPAPYTIYKNIRKLPAASLLCIDPRNPRNATPQPYWSLDEVVSQGKAQPFHGDAQEAVEELDWLLRDAVRIRMIADVPVGVFLSGGVDSSTIAALMQAESTQRVRSFSIGMRESDYNEAHHALRVARQLGTEHTELYVTAREAMELIPQLPFIYDEPFADSSQIPTCLLAKLTRHHVTVGLSGDAGDEIFGGYNRHAWGRRLEKMLRWAPERVRRAVAHAIRSVPPAHWNSLLQACEPLLPRTLRHRVPGEKLHKLAGILTTRDPESAYLALASHWPDHTAIVLDSIEPRTHASNATGWAKLGSFPEQMMFLDTLTYLPDDILVKVDRASMAVGLETRVPFLDYRVVSYAWSLDLGEKISKAQGKSVLRRLLSRYVPCHLTERPKSGFGVPIDSWLRGPLREWAESLLNEKRLRDQGYFNVESIRAIWREFLNGKTASQHHVWDILMFEAWWDDVRGIPAKETLNASR
jgi:asparagine synthase (glutamine-hydrolysing)